MSTALRRSGRAAPVFIAVSARLEPLPMAAFLVSFALVALAEMGDKTQLLALVLASRFGRPLPILAGILVATLLNHLLAGALGVYLGLQLEGPWVRWAISLSFFAVSVWALFPDRLDGAPGAKPRLGVFGATACAFFLAEIGDRTQLATVALGARYEALLPVVAGTTLGLMAANLPIVLLGHRLARRLPLRALRWSAAILFALLGIAALVRPG